MFRSLVLSLGVVPLVIGACGDISRIEPRGAETPQLPTPTSASAPVSLLQGTGRDSSPSLDLGAQEDPLAAAARAQVWRMQRQETAIARIPPTEAVPETQIDALRQQRMQAQSMAAAQAGSAALTRPTLGPDSGRPDFSYPAPAVSPQLNQAISRARTAESSALTR